MIHDPAKIRSLIDEYGQLRSLHGHNPQSRGQRFNHFIGELLQSWGIDAIVNARGSGEIDVGFQIDGKRFVLEAKWESDPIDTGPIAKLQKRLRQRLGDTIGIILSVSGYTSDSLRDVKQGEQLMVLLLEKDHLECMLAGFFPPREMIELLLDRASFFGDAYVPLMSLFSSPDLDQLGIEFTQPESISNLVVESVPGFTVKVVTSSLPFRQSGIAELSPGKVLVTLNEGIFKLDINKESIDVWLPVPGCSRNVLVGPDDITYFVRKAGIARLEHNQFSIVSGGFAGNVCLFSGEADDVWAFANGYDRSVNGIAPVVARLGQAPGNEEVYNLEYPASHGMNASLIPDGGFLISGSAGIAAYYPGQSPRAITNELINPMGLIKLSNSKFAVSHGSVQLSELDLLSCTHHQVARLSLQPSVSELAISVAGGGYLYSHYSDSSGQTKGIVLLWRY